MTIRFNLDRSQEITDPMLRSFHKQGEAACLEIQKHLDEGFFSLTDALTKINRFTERVRATVKNYQDEKNLLVPIHSLSEQNEEFLTEYQKYRITYLKAIILSANTYKTLQLIQPENRSRSDEKSLKENLPVYYTELKNSEKIFSEFASQIKKTQSILSDLKHRLHAAIESRSLAVALEKFRIIVEKHRAPLPRSAQVIHHISPFIRPPTIIEPIDSTPISTRQTPSFYDDQKPSWKKLPLPSMNRQVPTQTETLYPLSRRSNSSDPVQFLRNKRPSPPLGDSLSLSSPKREISPGPNSRFLSPRNTPHNLPPISLVRLSIEKSRSPRINKSPNTSRGRYTRLSGSGETPVPGYQNSKGKKIRPPPFPTLERKRDELDTPPEPIRGRTPYRSELNQL